MTNLHLLRPKIAAAAILAAVLASPATAQDSATDMTSRIPTAREMIEALTVTSKGGQQAIDLDVKFAFNSAQLTADAEKLLGILVLAMKAPELGVLSFQIEGHTDAIGSAVYNQLLSESRANSVYGHLVQNGVQASRLVAKGFGMTQLLDTANPAAAKNRRVRIISAVSGQQATTTPETTTSEATTETLTPSATIPVKFNYKFHLFSGGAEPGKIVDPLTTTFKTGDKFFLEFGSSVTGLFDLWNLSPGGTVTKLGRWPADAKKPLRLPFDGTQITFTREKGQELLVIQYYPCKFANSRNLALAAEAEKIMVDCSRIGEVPFKDDRNRNLEIASGPEGGTAQSQVDLTTTQSWTTTMLQFTIPLKHQ